MLDSADRERIARAIAEAEARTAGEIVCVVARAAGDYRTVPLVFALLVGLALPLPLLFLTGFSAQRIQLVALLAAGLCALLFSLPALRLRLVPRAVRRRRAHDAACREFLARGLTRTRDRTGVLIFVAAAERYAEVIADEGIACRVEARVWREAIEVLVTALADGRPADGLVAAVGIVGRVLAEHAPPRTDDVDEMPSRVFLI
ncbi:hypothetical protein QNA08_16090 [Chelatococcus sp. SYSU_G07232]|uniref:TPM domain-containing protein n=1 Tax=Chelatococcus albus TaxID=3047466 RepID=A0ABT7AMF3_9HYPH|nr:hypothetical protein [Chelatococcus sp. SYSU_G07232]MDJ1159746.1 hypothetical protein [Chelatococcus sp. SYSU_G07232]